MNSKLSKSLSVFVFAMSLFSAMRVAAQEYEAIPQNLNPADFCVAGSRPPTSTEFAVMILNSEALAITSGPHRTAEDVSVGAVSDRGLVAKSILVKYSNGTDRFQIADQASINCQQDGKIELE